MRASITYTPLCMTHHEVPEHVGAGALHETHVRLGVCTNVSRCESLAGARARSLNMWVCLHTCVTKNISLSDEAYEALADAKRPGESFSDLARRLARLAAREVLFDPAIRVNLSEQEADAWKQAIRAERDRSLKPRVKL